MINIADVLENNALDLRLFEYRLQNKNELETIEWEEGVENCGAKNWNRKREGEFACECHRKIALPALIPSKKATISSMNAKEKSDDDPTIHEE